MELNVIFNFFLLLVIWEKSVVLYFYYVSIVNIIDDRIFGGIIDDFFFIISNILLVDISYYCFIVINVDGFRFVVFYLLVNFCEWVWFLFLRKVCIFEYFL